MKAITDRLLEEGCSCSGTLTNCLSSSRTPEKTRVFDSTTVSTGLEVGCRGSGVPQEWDDYSPSSTSLESRSVPLD